MLIICEVVKNGCRPCLFLSTDVFKKIDFLVVKKDTLFDTKNNLKLIVTDNVGNNSTFEIMFYRK